MRNLKKVLALVLALVMSLSLVTIANASIDFSDAKDVKYDEAVDVMSSIGVIEGFETGAFNPAGTLTREQAAKIIAYMLLGPDSAEKLGAQSTGFTDVPATRWSSPYVGYCVSLGIVNGYGDGTFNPTGELTGYAFAKMLLTALGYGVNDEYVGSGWTLAVARDGMQIGLYDEVSVSSAAITRDEACQLAFDALRSNQVVWSELFNTYTAYSGSLGNQQLLGTLAGNVFKLNPTYKTDGYGYNTRAWRQENKVVTDYYFYAEIIDTVTDASLTCGNLLKDYTWQTKDSDGKAMTVPTIVNGTERVADTVATLKANTTAKLLKNGYVATLVDEDENGEVDKVIITIEYLAKVTKVNAETDSAKRSVDLTIYDTTGEVKVTKVETEDFEKDQYILVIPNADNTDGFKEPLEMKAAEAVTGSVSAYYNDTVSDGSKNANGSVTVDGVKYNYNGIYAYDEAMGNELSVSGSSYTLGSKASYTFYLDSQGYVIGAKVEDDSISDFAYVIAVGTDAFGKTNIVKVLKSDGTIGTYNVSSKSTATVNNNSVGKIYACSINSSGEIVLDTLSAPYTQVIDKATDTVTKFTKGSSVVSTSAGAIYANDETVFVYYTTPNNKDEVNMYTGKDNAPSITAAKAASAVYKTDSNDNKIAQYIVITTAAETAVTDNYVYVLDAAYRGTSQDKNEDTIYWYDVVMGTEVKTIAVDAQIANGAGVYKYSVNTALFDGDSANGVEAGVYTVSQMTATTEITTGRTVNSVISNTITVAAKDSEATVYEIGPDTQIVDVTDTNDVKFDESVEKGDTITVVFETSSNLNIAKTVIITKNA